MYNNAVLIDTVQKDSIAVPAALKWLEFARNDKDSAKFLTQISGTSYFLALYYQDKDKTKAIQYLTIMKAATKDPTMQENIQQNIDRLSKPQPQRSPQQATTKPKPDTPPVGTKPKKPATK
jgi:hypothetical protein